jgi:sucrose-6-phosphate hydrolase SacC (GH32 family)
MISRSLGKLSRGRVTRQKDLAIVDAGIDLGSAAHLTGNAYWIKAKVRVGGSGSVAFRFADRTIVGYDAAAHQFYIDKSHSAGLKVDTVLHHVPVEPVNGILTLEILVDGSSLEVFAGNGARVYTTMIFPDAGADGLSLFAKGGDFRVKELTIWNLGQ